MEACGETEASLARSHSSKASRHRQVLEDSQPGAVDGCLTCPTGRRRPPKVAAPLRPSLAADVQFLQEELARARERERHLHIELARLRKKTEPTEEVHDLIEEFRSRGVAELMYDKRQLFDAGLEEAIGQARFPLFQAMEDEHWNESDSSVEFGMGMTKARRVSGLGEEKTTSQIEWAFVVHGPAGLDMLDIAEYPGGSSRTHVPLSDFRNHPELMNINEVLQDHPDMEEMTEVEILALRLMTGPMNQKYIIALRGGLLNAEPFRTAGEGLDQCEAFESINIGNRYTTTLHVLKSALVKIGRGGQGNHMDVAFHCITGVPPKDFLEETDGVRGGTVRAYRKVYTDLDSALTCSAACDTQTGKTNDCVTIYEYRCGLDRPGSVKWISQSPYEGPGEILYFPPLTFWQVESYRREDLRLFVEVRPLISEAGKTVGKLRDKAQVPFRVEVGDAQRDLQSVIREFVAREGQFNAEKEVASTTLATAVSAGSIHLDVEDASCIKKWQTIEIVTGWSSESCVVCAISPITTNRPLEYSHPAGSTVTVKALSKFEDGKLIAGRPEMAALGIAKQLRVEDKVLWNGQGVGLQAMAGEILLKGLAHDLECFQYVVSEKVGSNPKQWPHAGNRVMDKFYDESVQDARAGQTIDYFVDHKRSRDAGLLKEHVVALRLYTTAAFSTINGPLREIGDDKEPHPFPVTVAYLQDGIKRLRALQAKASTTLTKVADQTKQLTVTSHLGFLVGDLVAVTFGSCTESGTIESFDPVDPVMILETPLRNTYPVDSQVAKFEKKHIVIFDTSDGGVVELRRGVNSEGMSTVSMHEDGIFKAEELAVDRGLEVAKSVGILKENQDGYCEFRFGNERRRVSVQGAELDNLSKRIELLKVSSNAVDFWRGMRNVDLTSEFRESGGTELAPMSTSSILDVALGYSNNAERRLLIKVATDSFMDRGADIQYLSAFPNEAEFLYPPMTFLQPTGKEEKVEVDGVTFTILEVSSKL